MDRSATKRFIKKVPPSGAAPVFKLTLPHRIVHSYLSHLVEAEFEIAPSANSTTCWQGTIAPRRNKDRSEYTLQGWRLFAEAFDIQAGDQIAFELVSPKRLVVQVMKTKDGRAAAAEVLQEDDFSPSLPPSLEQHLDWPSPEHSLNESLEFVDSGPIDSLPDTPPSLLISPKPATPLNVPSQPLLSQAPPTWEEALHLPEQESPPQGSYKRMMQHACSPRQEAQRQCLLSPALSKSSSMHESASMRDLLQPVLDPLDMQATSDCHEQSYQIRNLSTRIHSLQNELASFEIRAHKAKMEAAQMRLFFKDMEAAFQRQSRVVMQAGEALELVARQMGDPHMLAASDPSFAQKVMLLQSEMYRCVQQLKGSLTRMTSSVEF